MPQAAPDEKCARHGADPRETQDVGIILVFSDCAGLATGYERHLSDPVLEALFLRGALREADAGDLRVAVSAAGKNSHLSRLVAGNKQSFDGLNRLETRNVREPRGSDNITGGKNASHVS
jgi:hypothetical protein